MLPFYCSNKLHSFFSLVMSCTHINKKGLYLLHNVTAWRWPYPNKSPSKLRQKYTMQGSHYNSIFFTHYTSPLFNVITYICVPYPYKTTITLNYKWMRYFCLETRDYKILPNFSCIIAKAQLNMEMAFWKLTISRYCAIVTIELF